MEYTLYADDKAEQNDIETLQAEIAALESRAGVILVTPWQSPAQMQGYIDEMDERSRRYDASYGMKAFLWNARKRPTCRILLNDLQARLGRYRSYYVSSCHVRTVGAATTGATYPMPTPPMPPQPEWPDHQERMRRALLNLCVPNGHQLPSFRVSVCPICGRYPYL